MSISNKVAKRDKALITMHLLLSTREKQEGKWPYEEGDFSCRDIQDVYILNEDEGLISLKTVSAGRDTVDVKNLDSETAGVLPLRESEELLDYILTKWGDDALPSYDTLLRQYQEGKIRLIVDRINHREFWDESSGLRYFCGYSSAWNQEKNGVLGWQTYWVEKKK